METDLLWQTVVIFVGTNAAAGVPYDALFSPEHPQTHTLTHPTPSHTRQPLHRLPQPFPEPDGGLVV